MCFHGHQDACHSPNQQCHCTEFKQTFPDLLFKKDSSCSVRTHDRKSCFQQGKQVNIKCLKTWHSQVRNTANFLVPVSSVLDIFKWCTVVEFMFNSKTIKNTVFLVCLYNYHCQLCVELEADLCLDIIVCCCDIIWLCWCLWFREKCLFVCCTCVTLWYSAFTFS